MISLFLKPNRKITQIMLVANNVMIKIISGKQNTFPVDEFLFNYA